MAAGLIERRFAPWYRTTTSDPSVCAAIWSSQLDITESGHTMSVVQGPNALGALEVAPVASCAPTIKAPTSFVFAAFLPLLSFFALFAGGAATAFAATATDVNFLLYAAIGTCTSVLVGLLVSAVTGGRTPGEVADGRR